MRNWRKLFAMALALILALSVCGAMAEPIEVENFGGGVLEVRIWDNNQLAGIREIAEEWSALSGVQVNIQVIDWDNYWTMLEAGASGGEMPDVFWMHSNTAEMYMSAQKLLDLTPYIEASSQTDLANYLPGVTELYSKDGKQYAIPKDHDTIGLLYNEKLFEKYGVDVPTDDWTWDDYYTAAVAMTEAGKDDGVYGVAMNTTNNQDGYYNIIYAYGGYVISDDKKSSGWDNENTKAAMEFVGKLQQDAGVPQATVAENGSDRLFTSEVAAMVTQGSWMIISFMEQENAADFKWAMLPYHDANGNGQCDEGERTTIYNGLGWAASADTANPDAAYSLIEWFGSEAMQLKQAELGVTLAAYEGCSDPFEKAFGDTDISAFIRMDEEATLIFRPYSKYTTRWETEANMNLVPAWSDPSQMDSVLDGLAASMNALLAQE